MTATDSLATRSVQDVFAATHDERIAAFKEFVRIPSVSMAPEHADDCRAAATWLTRRMMQAGLENVEICQTGGLPVVYGDWLHAPGAPTVLVYGHYDVQPVAPIDAWDGDPFDAHISEGRITGRGTADDKGQVLIHLDAVSTLLTARGELPVNVRFIVEGEEECDDEHFEDWLLANADRVDADVVFVSDTGFFEGDIPAITVGLRGLVSLQIDVHGSAVQLHSGSHGGVAENPALALATILAGLVDESGRIAVDGFYDDVVELSDQQKSALADLPFDETAYLDQLGVSASVGETGRTLLERRGTRPTLDVNGIWGGFTGDGLMTIVPSSAHAKLSCRIVVAQRPERIVAALRAHVVAHTPTGVSVEITELGGGLPVVVPTDSWFVDAASRAIDEAFAQRPVFVWEGGSIPACEAMSRILDIPVLILGFTPPNCNTHAPNEWMSLDHYERGVMTVIGFLDRAGARG